MRESDKDLLEAEVLGKLLQHGVLGRFGCNRIVDVGLAMVLMGGHFFYDFSTFGIVFSLRQEME